MSLNKIMLIGFLGKDPESKQLSNGNSYCSFSIATTESRKDKQGVKTEHTEWHHCQAYGKLADICLRYLAKGSRIYLEGSISTRQYKDKLGVDKTFTAITASQVDFLSPVKQTPIDAAVGKFSGAPLETKAQGTINPWAGVRVDEYAEELPF